MSSKSVDLIQAKFDEWLQRAVNGKVITPSSTDFGVATLKSIVSEYHQASAYIQAFRDDEGITAQMILAKMAGQCSAGSPNLSMLRYVNFAQDAFPAEIEPEARKVIESAKALILQSGGTNNALHYLGEIKSSDLRAEFQSMVSMASNCRHCAHYCEDWATKSKELDIAGRLEAELDLIKPSFLSYREFKLRDPGDFHTLKDRRHLDQTHLVHKLERFYPAMKDIDDKVATMSKQFAEVSSPKTEASRLVHYQYFRGVHETMRAVLTTPHAHLLIQARNIKDDAIRTLQADASGSAGSKAKQLSVIKDSYLTVIGTIKELGPDFSPKADPYLTRQLLAAEGLGR
ncbi:hypothetical protein RYA05_01410 [Pseudomonas syringae pv. actinidiae]|nr:hypothetical protein [Pseudomonas syringae pv. actinidiae]